MHIGKDNFALYFNAKMAYVSINHNFVKDGLVKDWACSNDNCIYNVRYQ